MQAEDGMPAGDTERRQRFSIRKWGCGCLTAIAVLFFVLLAIGHIMRTSRPAAPLKQAMTAPAALTERPQSAADAYSERVETYWLSEARQLPSAMPADEAEIGRLLTVIDGLAINARDGADLALSKAQADKRAELIKTLANKQRALLPAMRAQYVEALDAKLFRRDIRVTSSGAGNTVLRFTGTIFARNANVEDMQTEMLPNLQRMRFSKTEYRWSPYFSDGLVYPLDAPGDGDVGVWNGGAFEKLGFD